MEDDHDFDRKHVHKTVKLTVHTRIPEWTRWIAIDEDGSVRAFRYKPKALPPPNGGMWWSRKNPQKYGGALGVTVLSSYGNINGDGGDYHCPGLIPPMYCRYFAQNPRMGNWREFIFRIRKTDFC